MTYSEQSKYEPAAGAGSPGELAREGNRKGACEGACDDAAGLPAAFVGAAGRTANPESSARSASSALETFEPTESNDLEDGTEDGTDDGGGRSAARCAYLSRVSIYHDGEMSEDESRTLGEHLATCGTCTEALAFFHRVSGTFETTAPARLEPEARARMRSLVSGRAETNTADRSPYRIPTHVRWVRRLTAVAAVLFIVAVARLAYERHPFGLPVGPTPVSNPVIPVNPPAATSHDRAAPSAPAGRGGDRTGQPSDDDRGQSPAAPESGPSTGRTIG